MADEQRIIGQFKKKKGCRLMSVWKSNKLPFTEVGQKATELKSLWYQVLSDVFHFESFDNVKSKKGPDL